MTSFKTRQPIRRRSRLGVILLVAVGIGGMAWLASRARRESSPSLNGRALADLLPEWISPIHGGSQPGGALTGVEPEMAAEQLDWLLGRIEEPESGWHRWVSVNQSRLAPAVAEYVPRAVARRDVEDAIARALDRQREVYSAGPLLIRLARSRSIPIRLGLIRRFGPRLDEPLATELDFELMGGPPRLQVAAASMLLRPLMPWKPGGDGNPYRALAVILGPLAERRLGDVADWRRVAVRAELSGAEAAPLGGILQRLATFEDPETAGYARVTIWRLDPRREPADLFLRRQISEMGPLGVAALLEALEHRPAPLVADPASARSLAELLAEVATRGQEITSETVRLREAGFLVEQGRRMERLPLDPGGDERLTDSPRLRAAALSVIAALGTNANAVAPRAAGFLKHLDDRVSHSAAKALVAAGPNPDVPIGLLCEAWDNFGIRSEVETALLARPSEMLAILPKLLRCLESPDPAMRVDGLSSVGKFAPGHPQVLPHVLTALRDPLLGSVASMTLTDWGEKAAPAIPTLREIVRGESGGVGDAGAVDYRRIAAAHALAVIGKPAATPAVRADLEGLLLSSDPQVRKQGRATLRRLFPRWTGPGEE